MSEIADLCGLAEDAKVLEVGCGCGRLARALAPRLGAAGEYCGFDIAPPLVAWCKQNLEPSLPNFRFLLADVRGGGHNPRGLTCAKDYDFPFSDHVFDLAVVSSVFTHMLPDGIENYVRQLARVIKPSGKCFMSLFLFDGAAELAVSRHSTIFDFRHAIGPCLTFDAERPEEGIACRNTWFRELLDREGFRIEAVRRGNWRDVAAFTVSQDRVVGRKAVAS